MNENFDKYYNPEIKERFIQEKENQLVLSTSYYETHLKRATKTEEKLNKDLCNWSLYEIIDYYKTINMISYDSLICLNNMFTQYTQFCLSNNLVKDNQNHYLECNRDLLSSCINKAILDKRIVDRKTILEWVNDLLNPKDQFILLSLFEYGKSKDFQDIVFAKPEDINGNTIKLSDRVVNISDKLIEISNDCISAQKYFSITGKEEKVMPLVDYGYIVKSYPNQSINTTKFQKGRNIYIACQRIFDYLGVSEWMSPNSISESGKLYMIKEKAKELNMTPIQFLYSDHIKEVELQYGCNIIRSTYEKRYKEYLL